MKRILIAGYERLTVHYRNAFSALGSEPSALCKEKAEIAELPKPHDLARSFDGLVLPGGGDISPALFDEENNGSRDIDEPLDLLQLALLWAFSLEKKPVLGICKGLQIINVGFGGTIRQNMNPSSLALHAFEGQDKLHPIRTAEHTFISRLYGPRPTVNSAHHQATGAIGRGLRVAAYAQDFVTEALYHESLPVFGVQWHPERLCFFHARPDAADGALLLRYFLSLVESQNYS